jgi:glycerophosphoryl diester phosphodiesterase
VRRLTVAAVAGCSLATSLAFAPLSQASGPTPPKACADVQLYWHRGDTQGGHTENSRSALRIAVDKGYGLETDLRTTKDGKIVLMHDPTVDRTTSGKGYVSKLTAHEIRSHRLNDGSKVPYLGAVLAMLTAHPGSVGMIELKPGAMPTASLKFLSSELKKRKLTNHVVIYSYDSDELSSFKDLAKGVATSLIPHGKELEWSADKFVPYGGVTLRSKDLTASLQRRAKKIDLPMIAWGAVNAKAWRHNVDAGTRALIMNRPYDFDKWCQKA